MDGIQKKPILQQEPAKVHVQPPRQPYQRQREELFISRHETEQFEKKRKKRIKRKKLIWFVTLFFLFSVLLYGGFFLWKAISVSKKINGQLQNKTNLVQDMQSLVSPVSTPLKGNENSRINILLLGAAGEKKPGGNLTDTIMIMSIDTKNNKVALLSLPRDFYVSIPGSTSSTKINSLYTIGIKENQGAQLIKSAVEKITGISINYYFAIDFDAFEKIIDDLGGINIISERDIYDPTYPGPNYSYQTFSLSKGFHHLDGVTALKYVRERHDDPEGDFGRAKRQQQVIQAVKNKMFSIQTIFNAKALYDILNTLSNNIKTDITFEETNSFINLSKKLDLQNITNVVVDAWNPDSLLKVSHIQLGSANAFILVPRVGNYSEIQDLAQNVFHQDEIKKRQDQIVQEKASVDIINKSGDSKLDDKIKTLLSEKFGIKNVTIKMPEQNEITDKTTISDNSGGQKIFTLDEFIKKIPASLSQDAQDQSSTDLTITLGTDIIDTYKYDEASMDEFNKAQDNQDSIDFTKIN